MTSQLSAPTLIRRLMHGLLNERRPELVDAWYAPDFVDHSLADDQEPGRDGLRASVEKILDEHPTLRVELDELIADGDRVATRSTWWLSGGERVMVMHMFIIRNGRVSDEWSAVRPIDPVNDG